MNILIFDHEKRILQFCASELWFVSFITNPQLYDPNPNVSQRYIIQALLAQNQHSPRATVAMDTEVQSWPLSDNQVLDTLPETQFLPQAQEWNFAIIDCVHKTILHIEEEYRFNYLDSAMIEVLLVEGLSNRMTHEDKNKLDYITRLHSLVEKSYLGIEHYIQDPTYLKSFAHLKKGLKEYVESRGRVKYEELDFGPDTQAPMYRLDIDPSKTGWDIEVKQFEDGPDVANEALRAMCAGGLLLSPPQLNAWQEFYQKSMQGEGRLDIEYVLAHREKKVLESSPVLSMSTISNQHNILPTNQKKKIKI